MDEKRISGPMVDQNLAVGEAGDKRTKETDSGWLISFKAPCTVIRVGVARIPRLSIKNMALRFTAASGDREALAHSGGGCNPNTNPNTTAPIIKAPNRNRMA